ITVQDTVPTIGTPADGEVWEAGLPTGSQYGDPTQPAISVSGALNVTPGKDTIDTTFTNGEAGTDTTVGQLLDLELTSGGADLVYVLSDDNHTLTAYKSDGAGDPTDEKVFTVQI